ncbi:MAG: terpene cyclase/mutase family protein [Planctomycetes bacterium]|nr:terpene cyclase/mutase family protein [Planctomycetota bacterium]
MHTAALALILAAPVFSDKVDAKPTVARGLKWLSEQQKDDGSWVGRANSAPAVTTAYAGLALLMEGSTPGNGKYAPHLRKALEWVEKGATENGSLAGPNATESTRPNAPHAAVLLFVACAYDVDDDGPRRTRLAKLLAGGVRFAQGTQSARGGWGTIGTRDDSLIVEQMLHALAATRKAGIEVPTELTDKAVQFLVKATSPTGGVYRDGPTDDGFGGGAGRAHLTAGAAAALAVHDGARPTAFRLWLTHLQAYPIAEWPQRPNATAIGLNLHLARLTYALGENGHVLADRGAKSADLLTWSAYRIAVFKSLRDTQGEDGSWVETVPGPTYGTAAALIILQLENDCLPAFSR